MTILAFLGVGGLLFKWIVILIKLLIDRMRDSV